MKVMIVDDSMFMRNVVKMHVNKEEGVELVGEAQNGQEAVEKATELKPDLIFMDIMMPVMTGLEALKKIRADHGDDIKVVMCTSVGQDQIMNEAIEAGAYDFIIKPFKPEQIKGVLEKAK